VLAGLRRHRRPVHRYERPANALVCGSVRPRAVVAGTVASAVGLFVISRIGLDQLVTEHGLPGTAVVPLLLVAVGGFPFRRTR
jgi:hypothetical protein